MFQLPLINQTLSLAHLQEVLVEHIWLVELLLYLAKVSSILANTIISSILCQLALISYSAFVISFLLLSKETIPQRSLAFW